MAHATYYKRAIRALLQWSLTLGLITVPFLSVHTPHVVHSLLLPSGSSGHFLVFCIEIVQAQMQEHCTSHLQKRIFVQKRWQSSQRLILVSICLGQQLVSNTYEEDGRSQDYC